MWFITLVFEGCGFVKFSNRDMALAAIQALNGIFVMRVMLFNWFLIFTNYLIVLRRYLHLILFPLLLQGCAQPLIVRFADPKKPREIERRLLSLLHS